MADIATGIVENTVSNWAAPVVGGLVSAALDTAGQDYQTYADPKIAAQSDLQGKAFTGIEGLAVPNTNMSTAASNLGNVYSTATKGITPITFNSPTAYTGNTYTAGNVSSGLGPVGSVQDYMNPYLQNVVDIGAREARRQSEIDQNKNNASLTKSGAFGGGRQAIMNAESQRNLQQQIGDIQSKGYNSAYDVAMKQRLGESEQNRLANEANTKYGLTAAQLNEESKQFGAKQSLGAAELAAKYGLEGQNLGLKYLQQAGESAKDLGTLGTNQSTLDLNRMKSMADMGATQRTIDQEGLTSDYNDWKEQRDWDKTQQTYLKNTLTGLPMTTQNQYAEAPSSYTSILGGAVTASEAYNKLFGEPKKKP